MDYYYSTGQVAGELHVSSQTIRNLCVSGQIKAERSTGGHYRITHAELERLKALESLPPPPRATMMTASANGRQATRNELIAPP
jgi:excisionase family DNA binding protein